MSKPPRVHPALAGCLFLLASACAGSDAGQVVAPLATVAPAPLVPAAPAPAPALSGDDHPDLMVVHRIKEEAYLRGRVMDHLFWLTDVNGPRLTASPAFRSAADWVVRTLGAWGAASPRLEPWGRFGRAWTLQRFEAALVEPTYARLDGVPFAWSRGTGGPVTGALVSAPLFPDREDRDDTLDLAKLAARVRGYAATWKGRLGGRFVLLDPPRDLSQPPGANAPRVELLPRGAEGLRFDERGLEELSLSPEHEPPVPWTWPINKLPRDEKKRSAIYTSLPLEVKMDFWERRLHVYEDLWRFFADERVLGVLATDQRSEGGIVFAESTGRWHAREPSAPAVVLSPEAYDRLARLAEKNVPAQVRLDVAVASPDKDEEGVNVVAELPGASKRDELVLLGAHLDSWHAGTGATDDGAGCAVMLEAVRILRALALPLARTVRIVLWSGEEQGYLGSRAYVKEHFADPVTMALKPEHAKVSAYFNLDFGSGRIRGVYLQGNDMARPIFEAWLAPFHDEGASTLSLRDATGTDHVSFDAVGVPAFQFIQDPLDYNNRTHHSNLDVADHARAGDLMQAAAIVATFVYEAANRPERLPRKPLPPPLPPRTPARD